jgi:hypothetical protein
MVGLETECARRSAPGEFEGATRGGPTHLWEGQEPRGLVGDPRHGARPRPQLRPARAHHVPHWVGAPRPLGGIKIGEVLDLLLEIQDFLLGRLAGFGLMQDLKVKQNKNM